ncbi:DNA polymerase III subunit beta [Bradyrhizobium sp. Ai1a-2]|uniref:DNA polymerase III subunit beta n=1 Tax=Bradyrhizobium sp. Ai1a-2 TaxID=196490 RepID=UPI0003FAD121|nr:DNA polymerase III subunit beta [Bradyrhizobium sp. Ai1a-2]
MKATLEHAALLKVLGRVHRILERRNTIPILSNVLIEVDQDVINVRATDLDILIADRMKAEVARKGATTVPGHMLHEIVRKMPTGSQVSIEVDESKSPSMIVKSGRSRFTLQTLPVSDFPDLSADDLSTSFSMPGKDLLHLVEKAQFAISTEETRFYLNGIFFHCAGGHNAPTLRAVATDGHRLAQVEIQLPDGAKDMPGVIIPRKTVGELSRLFGADDTIQIEVSRGKIRFSAGDIVLTSKLIDGTFPDYQRVIPVNNDKVLKVICKDIRSAVDRVATVSSDKGRSVKVSLEYGKVTLSCQNPDAGTATDELEAEFEGASLEIGFNSRYIGDILGEIDGDVLTVKLADPGSPTIFTGSDAGSLYVLMPMRVS